MEYVMHQRITFEFKNGRKWETFTGFVSSLDIYFPGHARLVGRNANRKLVHVDTAHDGVHFRNVKAIEG